MASVTAPIQVGFALCPFSTRLKCEALTPASWATCSRVRPADLRKARIASPGVVGVSVMFNTQSVLRTLRKFDTRSWAFVWSGSSIPASFGA